MVCDIEYIGKKYKGADAVYIAQLHESVEARFVKEADSRVVSSAVIPYFRPLSKRTEDFEVAQLAMNKTNRFYDAKVVTVKKDSRGMPIFSVNINPIADQRLAFYKDSLAKQANDPYAVRDGEVAVKDDYNYEQRVFNLNEGDEVIESYMIKANKMQDMFRSKGLNTFVILDGDLQSSGAVLKSTDPKVQGLKSNEIITDDTIVISVNPRNLFTDTVFHEYGHIFIDVIGGMQNPRILAAYNKLVGTPLYYQVKELYPELDDTSDKFKKELVTTALGKEANVLYEQEQNQSWWTRFVEWFSQQINRVLGIEEDAVKELSKQFLEGNFEAEYKFNDQFYEQRSDQTKSKKLRDQVDTKVRKLEDANQDIINVISRIVRQFESKTGIDINKTDLEQSSTGEEKYLRSLNEMKKKIQALNEGMSSQAIAEFISFRNLTAEKQLAFLRELNTKMRTGEITDPHKVINHMQTAKLYNETYVIAENIDRAIEDLEISSTDKALLKETLNAANLLNNDIHKVYLSLGRKVLLELMSPLEDIVFSERKDALGIEFNKNNPDVRQGETKQGYIDRKINEERPHLIEQTRAFVRAELEQSITDVGSFEALVRSEMNMNSMMVRLTSKVLNQMDFRRDRKFLEKRNDAVTLFREYNDKHGSTDLKKMWAPLMEESDGSPYLLSKYDIGLYTEQKKLLKKLNEAMEKDAIEDKRLADEALKNNKPYRTTYKVNQTVVKRELLKFRKENFSKIPHQEIPDISVYVPKSKWKSKRYEAIISNPNSIEAKMLNFLTELNEQSDLNVLGKKSLRRTAGTAEWFRLPALGRDTLEKVTNGDYVANAKDSIERMYKYMGDDTESGEVAEPESRNKNNLYKRVIADQVGEEKHIVPIHFRGLFDPKTHSYDLMTSIMTDFYMSTTHYERMQVLPIMEIILNVEKDKDINKTAGVKELIKYYKMDGKDIPVQPIKGSESNEFATLVSIIENRVYGIQTIDAEYGKIAETIMAWTGTTMLAMNFYAGIANVMQGQVQNLIEAVGGQFYNLTNVKNGEAKYLQDLSSILNDINSLNNSSRTNMMIDLIDPQGDFSGLKERFSRNTKSKSMASRDTLSAPNKLGEHFIQGQLLYSILDGIKVKTKDGKYLDKNLRPTDNKDKGISLDEALVFENGVAKLSDQVYSTTFSDTADGDQERILLETRSLVKKISADLHGLYDSKLQSKAQRTILGKTIFMLRKWLVPGFDRRWRGLVNTDIMHEEFSDEDMRHKKFYSSNLKSFQEGTYTSAVRMIRSLYKEGQLLNVLMISKSKTWENMADYERANVRKAVTEFTMIALTLVAAHILKNLAGELPEEEATALMVSAFAFRRLHQEMAAYVNPLEALQLMQSPAASVSMIQKASTLIIQTVYDGYNVTFGDGAEVYESGRRKGDYKIQKKFNDVVPVLSQTNRNAQDAMEYVFQSY